MLSIGDAPPIFIGLPIFNTPINTILSITDTIEEISPLNILPIKKVPAPTKQDAPDIIYDIVVENLQIDEKYLFIPWNMNGICTVRPNNEDWLTFRVFIDKKQISLDLLSYCFLQFLQVL
jgi:hypothetical protein